nr:MAG TPA: Integrase [Caudoviricetes sp.]
MKCRKCKRPIPDGSKYCSLCGAKQDITRKPRVRGNGQGSVYKLPNGKWVAIITTSLTIEGGKVKRATLSKSGFTTKRDAENYIPVLRQSSEKKPTAEITMEQLYNAWLPTHRAGASTITCYKSAYKHFAVIKDTQFASLALDDWQECLDDCSAGKRTRQNMKALCGLLYKYAIPRRIVDNINIGQYLRVTGDTSSAKPGFPTDAINKMWQHTDTPGVKLILCQCYLGFRPTEFLTLRVEDYDAINKLIIGGAKTEAGKNRIVTISPKIQPYIDELASGRDNGLLITADGAALTLPAYRKLFYTALDACGIDNPTIAEGGTNRKKYTPHSCRHTFATLMKRVEGADKDKLELIGHTSPKMLRHYQDVDIDDIRKITDAI